MWRLEQVQRKITGKVACNIYKSAFIKQASLWSESRFSSAFISGVSLLSPVETKGRGVQVSQPVMLFDTIPIITTTLRPAEWRMSSNTWRAVSYTLHTIYQRQYYPKCTLDHFHVANESPYSFQTKAAKLIHKVIGLNSYVSKFDVLQAKLKSTKLEKPKPTPTEMEDWYIKLSAQLHTSILSAKHTTRDDIKALEKDYHQTHCTYPDCRNPEYGQLRKKLDLAEKLSGLWDNYFNVI